MRTSIPQSEVTVGHPRFAELAAIRDDLCQRANGLKAIQSDIPPLLREAIDIVIDTPRTGRRSYDELEKTEKTYIGTRVEILVRSYFQLPKGALDVMILDQDADVKFTIANNWMIPREAVGAPCLLLAADEQRALCFFGIFYADLAYLTAGANQDMKRQISSKGFANIMWLFCQHPLTQNFWQTISPQAAATIAAQRSGNERVITLFREVQDRPIAREVIEATARQKDFMRRIRADNGRGTRDRLAQQGLLLLSGAYDAPILRALGMPGIDRSEFISHKLTATDLQKLAPVAIPKSFRLAP